MSFLIVAAVLALAAVVGRPEMARFRTLFLVLVPGMAGLLILLQRPGLGLVALAALSFTLPFSLGTGTEVRLTPPVFLISAIAGVWLVTGLHGRSLRLPASRTHLPLVLFLGSGLLSLVAGRAYWDPLVPQPSNMLLVQLGQWGLYALSAVIFVLAGDLGQDGHWLELATWTFLAAASVVVLEFYVPPLRRALGWSAQNMASRSMFWVCMAALGTGQLLFNGRLRPWVRLWLVGLLLGGAYAVWFPLSTWSSGWTSFTVSAVVVACLWVWRRKRALALAVMLGLLVLAVVLYPVVFEHSGGEREFEAAWGGRTVLYQAVLEAVEDHALLGLGPVGYRYYAGARWLATGFGRALYLNPQVSSHNNYIDIYAQQGLVGLALFLWFLLAVARTGWILLPRFREDFADGYVQGAFGALAGTLVSMMLADWFLPFVYNIGFVGFRTSALAWMFLGGLVALEQTSSHRPTHGETFGKW